MNKVNCGPWPTVPLGKCCEIISGSTPRRDTPAYWDGDILWATPKDLSDLDDIEITETSDHITDIGLKNCSANMVPEGTVLFSSRAPIGLVAIAGKPMCTNQGFKNLVPGKNLDSRFLYWTMRKLTPQIQDMGNGATFKEVSKAVIERVEIPLPPLSEQKRIAAILDKADSIRRKRQAVMQELKNLRLAAFYGLFRQDLALDNMKECLTDVAEVVSGVAKGRKLNGSDTREVPYLRVANVQSGYLDLSEIKTIPAKETEINAYSLRIGDIVMTEGGDHDKLGRGALWERDILNCIHQNHVFRVRLNQEKLLPRFFVYFLQSSIARQYFLRCAKKTTNLASINMTQLRALPVPHVPLVRQEVFEAIVVSIDSCLERQTLFATEAEDLFSSLVQRAFKGEL